MAKLEWGTPNSRLYETGVDRGVLYLEGQPGVPWVGLTSVEMSPSGGGSKSYYLDGNKYLIASSAEEFGATINAYTYPPEFGQCDGSSSARPGLVLSQQRRKTFGFSYRTIVGSETNGDLGYKIHLVYNAMADPTDRSYSSVGEDVEPIEFSWSISTKPPAIPGYKRTSHIEIDSRTTDSNVLRTVEEALYGTDEDLPRLPSFAELLELYDAFFVFVVTDNGDGIYTVSGPDDAITELGEFYLQFNWPTVVQVDEDSYTISSG
ncbi:major tail protein [Streptomyces phage Kardashian]|nr:major tail protein [Streptomyces phage Kardashian]